MYEFRYCCWIQLRDNDLTLKETNLDARFKKHAIIFIEHVHQIQILKIYCKLSAIFDIDITIRQISIYKSVLITLYENIMIIFYFLKNLQDLDIFIWLP